MAVASDIKLILKKSLFERNDCRVADYFSCKCMKTKFKNVFFINIIYKRDTNVCENKCYFAVF